MLIDEEGKYLQSPSFKSMEFSPDGEFLAIADSDCFANVWLWQVADGRLHQMLYGHPWSHRILGLTFTPDGRYLIGSEWSTDPEEESIPIWELSSGKRVGKLPRMAWLPAISPDGQFVASMNEDALLLWNFAERKIVWQGEGDGAVHKLTFDPSGYFLLLCGSNNTVQWHNVQDGQKAYILRGADLSHIKLASDPPASS
jgi:WD40 repeat protein